MTLDAALYSGCYFAIVGSLVVLGFWLFETER